MTRSVWGILLVLAVALTCRGQITVEIVLNQEQYLPGESLPIAVRVTNRSGRALHLGAEEDWLTFAIEAAEGGPQVVPKVSDPPVVGAFLLDNLKVATKRTDLAPHFGLSRPGRYTITATVRIPEWDREVVGRSKVFNLIEGAKLWEREFGIPNTAHAGGTPEVRKYILQQANYLRGQIRLYLRLTDGTGLKVFRVYPIGSMVSFSRPEPQVDKEGNLHVLYQNGPHSSVYFVCTHEGDVLIRQVYDFTQIRPRLNINSDGVVTLSGGVRRVTRYDIPAQEEASAPADSSSSSSPDEDRSATNRVDQTTGSEAPK